MNGSDDHDVTGHPTLAHNRGAWDRMASDQHVLTRPASQRELQRPLQTVDASGWLRDGIQGWNVLCLAAGGGRHGPLYAAAGGNVTVVDLSPVMLQRDREVASHYKLSLRTIEASMDWMPMLGDGHFDLVIHPVSTCYLPKLDKLFPEVARVTRPGGLYISQHKQPTNLQASLETHLGQYVIEHGYYDPTPVPPARSPSKLREPGTREYAHSWESILAGICRSGFVIEDVTEPHHAKADSPAGSFAHRCSYIAPYIRLKARRCGQPSLRCNLLL
ncbi:MAG: class I SAM-dependent methyltransferase [Planctomycetales bacterium]|nr:class I SAM-dependent methyltransferase [Planctomycetales bacterium]